MTKNKLGGLRVAQPTELAGHGTCFINAAALYGMLRGEKSAPTFRPSEEPVGASASKQMFNPFRIDYVVVPQTANHKPIAARFVMVETIVLFQRHEP